MGKFHDPLEGYYAIKTLRIRNLVGYLSKVGLFALWMYVPRYFGVHIGGLPGAAITVVAIFLALGSGYSYGFIAGLLFGAAITGWWPFIYYAVIRGIGFIFYDRLLAWMTKMYKPTVKETIIPKEALEPPKEKDLESML